jgi:hypothetical protein
MTRALIAVVLVALLAVAGVTAWRTRAQAAGPFSDWAAVVVAGDFHAHSGAPSEAFDNARREVAHDLVGLGFEPQNLRQFSVRPELYPGEHLMLSEPGLIGQKLADTAGQARGGCRV